MNRNKSPANSCSCLLWLIDFHFGFCFSHLFAGWLVGLFVRLLQWGVQKLPITTKITPKTTRQMNKNKQKNNKYMKWSCATTAFALFAVFLINLKIMCEFLLSSFQLPEEKKSRNPMRLSTRSAVNENILVHWSACALGNARSRSQLRIIDSVELRISNYGLHNLRSVRM